MNCAVTIYSLFYSVMKSRSYWNSNTHYPMLFSMGKYYKNNLSTLNNWYLSSDDLPKTVDLCGTDDESDCR